MEENADLERIKNVTMLVELLPLPWTNMELNDNKGGVMSSIWEMIGKLAYKWSDCKYHH